LLAALPFALDFRHAEIPGLASELGDLVEPGSIVQQVVQGVRLLWTQLLAQEVGQPVLLEMKRLSHGVLQKAVSRNREASRLKNLLHLTKNIDGFATDAGRFTGFVFQVTPVLVVAGFIPAYR